MSRVLNEGITLTRLSTLHDRGFQFIKALPSKAVSSYSSVSAAAAYDHVKAGGALQYQSPSVSTIDIDVGDPQELIYELGNAIHPRAWGSVRSTSQGRWHVVVPCALDDYNFGFGNTLGEIRHARYTMLYSIQLLLRMPAQPAAGLSAHLSRLLQPRLPSFQEHGSWSGADGYARRGFSWAILNIEFDWRVHAKRTGVPIEEAAAAWNTGVRAAHLRVERARRRCALLLADEPRRRTKYEVLVILHALHRSGVGAYPSTLQLGAALGVHRTNAARALARLAALGLIERIGQMPGRGLRPVARWSIKG